MANKEKPISPEQRLTGIRLVIFDWSGVISDDRRPAYEANMCLLEEHDEKRMTFDEWVPRTKSSAAEFLAACGIDESPDILSQRFAEVLNKVKQEGVRPQVYKDAPKILTDLRRQEKILVVISSHPQQHLLAEAEEYGLAGCFNDIRGDIRDKSRALQEVCQEMDIRPEAAIYVGDMTFDIKAAKTAGVHSVGITTGCHGREKLATEEPDLLLDCLTDLLANIA